MVRCLLRNIVTLGAIWIVPVSREDLSENWIERLLYAPTRSSAGACGREEHTRDIRRFDVPAAQVKLGHGYKSLHGVFNLGDGEHSLGVCHEAISIVSALPLSAYMDHSCLHTL
jgi:hypothetical protein